jgi:uncharacterized iron-regulated membrane protein
MRNLAALYQLRERLYRFHTWSALIAAAWLLLLAVTGVLINHQESLGLTEVEISDSYFPDYYHSDFRTGSIRANVVLTDLHSGRIFGAHGNLVGDLFAALILFSVATGLLSYWLKRRLQGNGSMASGGRRKTGAA